MHPKLLWAHELAASLGHAMGCGVSVTTHNDVDPLKKYVHFKFGEDLGKGNYQPIQKMMHTFAQTNDCVIHKIWRPSGDLLILEVFTKTRLGPRMAKNPLKSGDKPKTKPET